MTRKSAAALGTYVLCIVAANYLTATYGLVWAWFGLVTTAGTYAAGGALLARDWAQNTAGSRPVLAAMGLGLVITCAFSPKLAFASGSAFLVSELVDMFVFTNLRRKQLGWAKSAVGSNIVSSPLDSLVFLLIAGFPVWANLPGQIVGKLLWATLVPVVLVLVVRRVVLRQPVHAEGA